MLIDYEEIPEIWASIKDDMEECHSCSVESYPLVEGTVTHYQYCEDHRQQLYREYALQENAKDNQNDDQRDLATLVSDVSKDGWSGEDFHHARRLAKNNPDGAASLSESLFDYFETEVRGSVGWWQGISIVAAALGYLAASNDPTMDRLVGYLDDDSDRMREYAHVALQTVAWFRPDRIPPSTVDRLGGALRDDEDSVARAALGVLYRLSREQPDIIGDRISTKTASRFFDGKPGEALETMVLIGHLSRDHEVIDQSVRPRLTDRLSAEDVRLRGGAAIALGLAGEMDRQECRECLRTLFDPSRYGETAVREAAAALGYLGTSSDAETMEYRIVKQPEAETKAVIADAIDRIRDRE